MFVVGEREEFDADEDEHSDWVCVGKMRDIVEMLLLLLDALLSRMAPFDEELDEEELRELGDIEPIGWR